MNDLHALDCDTYTWRQVQTRGEAPQQRANHSSAVLEETNELVIFGGWNGRERLNDIHILDTETGVWTRPRIGGELPYPRAGMTLTALRGRLFLFGGSGTSSKCFNDLQILDRKEMAWLNVTQIKNSSVTSGVQHRSIPSTETLPSQDRPTAIRTNMPLPIGERKILAHREPPRWPLLHPRAEIQMTKMALQLYLFRAMVLAGEQGTQRQPLIGRYLSLEVLVARTI